MKWPGKGEGWRRVGLRWLKFNAVGALGVGVQLATLAALTSGLDFHYLVATGLAVEAAVGHNFIWHECWTWGERTRLGRDHVLGRFVRFNLTTGAQSIVGNLAFMGLLVGALHLHYFWANLLTLAACSILNFLVSDRFVFRTRLGMTKKERLAEEVQPSGSGHWGMGRGPQRREPLG